ncbi:hypothetical protein DFQ28_004958 [Apophysomyces sp. BC1034]|nr:hypothetical protein DFQ28_004958 [Apophysomyces sp. BC1034]
MIKEPTVYFDIKLDKETNPNAVWIETSVKDDIIGFHVQHGDAYDVACIDLGIRVELPSVSSFNTLNVEMTSNDIIVEGELEFMTDFQLTTVIGNVMLQNASANSVVMQTSHGNIQGYFHQLATSLSANTDYGHIDLDIASILQGNKATSELKASAISGNIRMNLPKSFYSYFDLTSYSRMPTISPENLPEVHLEATQNKKHLIGSYGKSAGNKAILSTDIGNAQIRYVM